MKNLKSITMFAITAMTVSFSFGAQAVQVTDFRSRAVISSGEVFRIKYVTDFNTLVAAKCYDYKASDFEVLVHDLPNSRVQEVAIRLRRDIAIPMLCTANAKAHLENLVISTTKIDPSRPIRLRNAIRIETILAPGTAGNNPVDAAHDNSASN